MVERLKDDTDRKLDELFGSVDVRDDGFSVQVMQRVSRQVWVRRLAMPVALVIGVLLAAKPLTELFAVLSNLVSAVPAGIVDSVGISALSTTNLPQMSTVFLGAMLLAAVLMISRMLED